MARLLKTKLPAQNTWVPGFEFVIGRTWIVDRGDANRVLVGFVSDATNNGEFVYAVAGDVMVESAVSRRNPLWLFAAISLMKAT